MAKINRQLIAEKSETVLRCLKRVQSKLPASYDDFLLDIDVQDIIALNLERSVQACVDIASHIIAYTPLPGAPTMADSFIVLQNAGILSPLLAQRMIKSVGLRNILVHQYRLIDWKIIWVVLQTHLNDPVEYVKEIKNWNEKD